MRDYSPDPYGPVQVEFQGWRSTVWELERAGWRWAVSYRQDFLCHTFIVENERLHLAGMCEDVRDFAERGRWSGMPLMFNQIGHKDKEFIRHTRELPEFTEVTFNPMVAREANMRQSKLSDCFPFQPKTTEVCMIESQADLDALDLLEQILAGQKDKQNEIWERRKNSAEVVTPERQTLLRVI